MNKVIKALEDFVDFCFSMAVLVISMFLLYKVCDMILVIRELLNPQLRACFDLLIQAPILLFVLWVMFNTAFGIGNYFFKENLKDG